ncbi:enoyl-CoA hydratase-related protein [Nocardioides zeae]|uniref:Enoyl-CoA hydratase-related protein n=1 Tax=Nocardioides imazamoxiresistens TaxID=3231893 RepID=A0ABU3PR10_9ACTN|nr:enoyl-CoA hydratase-related protein [Nocardioides zeae]MDT9591659.1 enoyl-CoA hydratase-related protein [Nocardioides zeae]
MSAEALPLEASDAERVESFGPVAVVVRDGVATVTVDSPPVNAMGRAVLGGLGEAAAALAAADDVRVVVLTGAGTKAFMAGADIEEFETVRSSPGGMATHSEWAGGVLAAWAALPQPVIAAVQASAVGGGLEIALTADLVVTDPRAKFGLPEVKLGLIPGGGGTQRLPRRVGTARALRLMLLGSVVPASAALEMGLVDEVAEPGEVLVAAEALAARIAAMPRVAVQALKRCVDPGLSAAIDEERRIFLEVARSEDFVEGVAAFVEKRPAVYTHR